LLNIEHDDGDGCKLRGGKQGAANGVQFQRGGGCDIDVV
jgi:hypothetical protein